MTDQGKWTVKRAREITGGLSSPSKMPGPSWGTPATECRTGAKLALIEGSTCHGCYALKGAYVWPVVRAAYTRRLDALNDPQWTSAMIFLVGRQAAREGVMRWQDSGDLRDVAHLRLIVAVCDGTPEIRHWLPTREYRTVTAYLDQGGHIPANLTIRLSAHMNDGVPPLHLAARHPRLTVSTVADQAPVPEGSHGCPAPTQGNACGDCRACWDSETLSVTYHRH